MQGDKRPQLGWQSLYLASRGAYNASQSVARLMARVQARAVDLGARPPAAGQRMEVPVDHYLAERFPQIYPLRTVPAGRHHGPSVTVLCFLRPQSFFGGVATLLLVAANLAQELDLDLRLVQTSGFARSPEVVAFLHSNRVEIDPERVAIVDVANRARIEQTLPLHPDDVVLASAWWDAHLAARLPLRRPFVYLIQDFEPLFYNSGDAWLLANDTYRRGGFIPLLNTALLRAFFVSRGYEHIGEKALVFEPAVNPLAARAPQTDERKRRLFLYARPGVDRNLFYTGLNAVAECVRAGDLDSEFEWELCCAGEDAVPSVALANGVTMRSLGKLDAEAYRRLLLTVDVAVSPMLAPHPNYPTLEFAASGAAVVTTEYENKRDLRHYSENIHVSAPNVADLAAAIAAASRVGAESRRERAAASNIGSDWSLALKEPLRELAVRLGSEL